MVSTTASRHTGEVEELDGGDEWWKEGRESFEWLPGDKMMCGLGAGQRWSLLRPAVGIGFPSSLVLRVPMQILARGVIFATYSLAQVFLFCKQRSAFHTRLQQTVEISRDLRAIHLRTLLKLWPCSVTDGVPRCLAFYGSTSSADTIHLCTGVLLRDTDIRGNGNNH